MRCTCATENPAGAKFCIECGQPLRRSCSACGGEVAADANFCPQCGARVAAPLADLGAYTPRHLAEQILSSRAAIEGERKQVTVLFCDVRESMRLSAALDPERGAAS